MYLINIIMIYGTQYMITLMENMCEFQKNKKMVEENTIDQELSVLINDFEQVKLLHISIIFSE